MPIFAANGAIVYLRDVAQVRDGNPPQQNIVNVDGGRSVVLQVLKNGTASTLAIIDGIKQKVADMRATLPEGLSIALVNDQSLFVENAIGGVVSEAVIAAVLTSLMILLFLGTWRSTVIIATSIPLAILAAIAMLALAGETLNIMTLGGLALAVGILVDDATVTIENINWHLEQGKGVIAAITDGAQQIATPAFVSTLCICIVFVPMFFLEGVPRFLFVPMALAVMFAMALVVLPVAHAGADHGHVSPQAARRARPRRTAADAQSAGALPARLRGGLRGLPRRLPRPARAGAAPPRGCSSRASWASSRRRSCWRPLSAAISFPRSMPAAS